MDITGIDKAHLLVALYGLAKPLGMGFMQFVPGPLDYSEAKDLLEKGSHFDYLKGRVMKVNLAHDTMSVSLYDRDNGEGTGALAIEQARAATESNQVAAE